METLERVRELVDRDPSPYYTHREREVWFAAMNAVRREIEK